MVRRHVCVPLRGSFENDALENEDRSTKHPNLENEDLKSRKQSTLDRKNEAPTNSKTKTPRSKTKHPKLENVVKRGVRVIRASLTLGFQPFVSCLFTLDAPSHLHKNPEAGLFFNSIPSFIC